MLLGAVLFVALVLEQVCELVATHSGTAYRKISPVFCLVALSTAQDRRRAAGRRRTAERSYARTGRRQGATRESANGEAWSHHRREYLLAIQVVRSAVLLWWGDPSPRRLLREKLHRGSPGIALEVLI